MAEHKFNFDIQIERPTVYDCLQFSLAKMQVLVSSKQEKPVNPLLIRLFGERKLLN